MTATDESVRVCVLCLIMYLTRRLCNLFFCYRASIYYNGCIRLVDQYRKEKRKKKFSCSTKIVVLYLITMLFSLPNINSMLLDHTLWNRVKTVHSKNFEAECVYPFVIANNRLLNFGAFIYPIFATRGRKFTVNTFWFSPKAPPDVGTSQCQHKGGIKSAHTVSPCELFTFNLPSYFPWSFTPF